MSEFMTIHPSHFGCIKSTVLEGLRKMYIDMSIGPSVIDPDEGCCITRCIFLFPHIIPRVGDKLKMPTKESFYVFSFDDTITAHGKISFGP